MASEVTGAAFILLVTVTGGISALFFASASLPLDQDPDSLMSVRFVPTDLNGDQLVDSVTLRILHADDGVRAWSLNEVHPARQYDGPVSVVVPCQGVEALTVLAHREILHGVSEVVLVKEYHVECDEGALSAEASAAFSQGVSCTGLPCIVFPVS